MSNYTTYLRWGVIATIFAGLIIPFIIADGGDMYKAAASVHNWYMPVGTMFFPYITGKNFVFRIIVEIGLFFYILLALREPRYRPKGSLIMWCAAALVVWMGLSTLTSLDPSKSFWSNFERMDGYINLLHLFVWFVITGAVLTADNLWERFINTSIGFSMLQGCIALFQILHWFGFAPSSQSGARADTTFGNATYLAVYMLFNLFLTLFMLARRGRTTGWQVFYGLAMVLQVVALIFTQTRGAQLGFAGGLVVAAAWVFFFAQGGQYKMLRRYAIGAVGVLAVLALVLFVARDTSFVENSALGRLTSLSLNDSTIKARIFYIWPMALKGIVQKPVAGWGEENFSYVFNANYNPAMYNQEQWFDRAHNQFLDFGIAGGIPALALYLALFALVAWSVWRSSLSVPEQAALLGLLAGYGFNNLVVFDNLVSFMYFFALAAFVHGLVRQELPRFMFLARPMSDRAIAVAAPVVAIVVGLGAWSLNASGIVRASSLADVYSSQGSPQGMLTSFESARAGAWPGSPMGAQEVAEHAAELTSNTVSTAQIDPALKQKFLTFAVSSMEEMLNKRPNDARLELFMATLLGQYGAYEQALVFADKALAHSPGKQQILMQKGLIQLQAGDSSGAIASLKQAFDEAPGYSTARVLLATAYYKTGDTARGDALIVEEWGSTVADDNQLLDSYINAKLWSRAAAIWKLRIQKDPKNAQNHLSLASVYFRAGDKANTIAELKEVMKLDPSSAAQIQTLIGQIESGTLTP